VPSVLAMTKMLNFRVEDDFADLIDEAWRASGAADRSTWLRETVHGAALQTLSRLVTRSNGASPTYAAAGIPDPHPPRALMLQRRIPPDSRPHAAPGCQHPLIARVNRITHIACRLCGGVVRWIA
jgi:hypothetical protein